MRTHAHKAAGAAVAILLTGAAHWAQAQVISSNFDTGGATVSPCIASNDTPTPPTLSGVLAAGWQDNTCWKNVQGSTIVYGLDTATRYAGKASMSIVSSGVTPQLWAPFTMKVGKSYTATLYLRASTNQEVDVQLRLAGSPYTSYGLASKTIGTSWTKVTLTADAPISATDVAAGLFIVPKTPGSIWVDSVTVTEGSAATAITRTGQTVAKTFFGVHNHRDVRWPDLGNSQGADRMWDGEGVQMADIFPTSDLTKANWTAFDARIALAKANGADIIMTLGGNLPAWASADPHNTYAGCDAYKTGGSSAPPVSLTVWQNMVTAVVKHANGAIKYWEIWNEPYMCSMFNVRRPTDYLSYLKDLSAAAYKIIKANSSSLVVLSPTLYTYRLDFVDQYLALGGGAYADIFAIHAYDEYLDKLLIGGTGAANAPEMLFIKEHGVNNFRNVLARYSYGSKTIWDTESGYLNSTNADGTPNDTQGAPYVARHLLLSSIAGVDRSYYYAWDQGGIAVTLGRETATGSGVYAKTAAGLAYQKMATWLTGAKITAVSAPAVDGQPWVVTLSRASTGTTEYIVWNPMGASVSYTPPTGMLYTSTLRGSKAALPTDGSFTVNGWPQLLTNY